MFFSNPKLSRARNLWMVQRLEREAAAHPRRYRARVLAWVGLGYGVLFATLALAVGAIIAIVSAINAGDLVGIVGLPIVWLSLLFLGILLPVLFRRPPPPEGLALTPEQVPALFAAIQEARRHVGGPRVHQVRLVTSFNLAITQRPRLGWIGPSVNTLHIGLPALGASSPAAIQAILAHEMAHLAAGHGRAGGRVYGVVQRWTSLHRGLEGAGGVGTRWLVAPFLAWYLPRLSDVSFVMRRQEERFADAAEVAMGGLACFADSTLLWAAASAGYHEVFCRRLWAQVADRATPPADALLPLLDPAAAVFEPGFLAAAVQKALWQITDRQDTHPAPRDRLLAAGVADPDELPMPSRPARSAARALLGDAAEALSRQLSALWAAEVASDWAQKHRESGEALGRLAELDRVASRARLPEPDRVERARLAARFAPASRAIPLLQEALALAQGPEMPLRLGELQLGQGDPQGLEALEEALARDPNAIPRAAPLAHAFLHASGDAVEARRWLDRARDYATLLRDAAAERSRALEVAPFLRHDLGAASLRRVVAVLEAEDAVSAAWLVKVPTTLLRARPLYVLAVRVVGVTLASRTPLLTRLEGIELGVPSELVAWILGGLGSRELALRAVPGAQVYDAAPS